MVQLDIAGAASVHVKLDYLVHPYIQGNKWRKLKYLLQFLQKKGCTRIASMGGAFSNHIHALAQLKRFKPEWQIEVYVRGEESKTLSPTLVFAQAVGLVLHFTNRTAYRSLREKQAGFYEGQYWLPEGGTTSFALEGCSEIITELTGRQPYPDIILLCGGTGGTAAGVIKAASRATVWVHSSLSGFDFSQSILKLLNNKPYNFNVVQDESCGRFGKTPAHLITFINDFYTKYKIPLDPIYTGKLFYWLLQELERGTFVGKHLCVIHTGGLDGIANYNFRFPQRPINIPLDTISYP